MKFKDYLNEATEMEAHLQALVFLMEQDLDTLNEDTIENLDEAFDKHLKKLGLKLHKSKGIIDYIKSFAKGAGKVLLYIIKGDHEKAKAILKDMKKEDILDFLYKLDLGTMHLVTGPIHMIDAWTGWDLAVNLSAHMEKGEGISIVLKQSITKVRDAVTQMFAGNQQKRLLSHVDKIEVVAV